MLPYLFIFLFIIIIKYFQELSFLSLKYKLVLLHLLPLATLNGYFKKKIKMFPMIPLPGSFGQIAKIVIPLVEEEFQLQLQAG